MQFEVFLVQGQNEVVVNCNTLYIFAGSLHYQILAANGDEPASAHLDETELDDTELTG